MAQEVTKNKACELFGVTKYAIEKEIKTHGMKKLGWARLQKNPIGQPVTMIDVNDERFLDWVQRAKIEQDRRKRKAPAASGGGALLSEDPEIQKLEKQSFKATLQMPIVKLKHEKFKTKSAENKIRKESGDLVPWQLAEVYSFGFVDRFVTEALRSGPKLRRRIREGLAGLLTQRLPDADLQPEVDKALREFLKGSDIHALAVEIEKMVVAEIEETARTTKADQRIAVEKWREEEGQE